MGRPKLPLPQQRLAFQRQKSNAGRRGIAWQLTFEQWWEIWSRSGKWKLRGLGRYCMSRPKDKGPYAIGNVRIVLNEVNCGELTYQHTEEAKLKIGAFHKGNQYCLGRKNSAITRQRISKSNKGRVGGFEGKHHSEKTKALKRRTWRNQFSSAEEQHG